MIFWWPEPTAGEIVCCHFPDGITPRPKPRPALILAVFDENAPHFDVRVAYGTSQKTNALHRGEFLISRTLHPAAYQSAGLSYDTKFEFQSARRSAVFDGVVLGATHGATRAGPDVGYAAPVHGARR